MGGLVISFIVFAFFLKIFFDVNVERHRQSTMESFDMLASDLNSFCDRFGLESVTKTASFSELARNLYVSDDGEDHTVDQISSGRNLCIDFRGSIECQPLGCVVELKSDVRETSLASLINRIAGNFGFNEYRIRIYKVGDQVKMGIEPVEVITTTTASPTTTARRTTTTTIVQQPSMRLIFVPVNWDSGQDVLNNAVDDHFNTFIENTPLDSCRGKVLKIIAQNCQITGQFDNGCNLGPGNNRDVLADIKNCADSQGIIYDPNKDRIVGLTDDDIQCWDGASCNSGCAGYTYIPQTTVILEYGDKTITAHELGHTYGLCDEYLYAAWDQQNSDVGGCPNSYPVCCSDHPSCSSCDNCLDTCMTSLCAGNICTSRSAVYCRGIMGPGNPQNLIDQCYSGSLERRYSDLPGNGAQAHINSKLSC